MPTTLVVQSHRDPLPYDWLRPCLDSVEGWARQNQYQYQFLDDAIFDLLEPDLVEKIGAQIVIATDLARLKILQQGLEEGYDRVVWFDADFLIFDPGKFILPDSGFALGREVWVQRDEAGRLKTYKKLHNAFLMFCRDNHFLDFYRDTAERLVRQHEGSMVPQFIGPKLLTALHNIGQFPVMEAAGMLSPLVMRDLIAGEGPALDLLRQKSSSALAGANLSSSLTEREGLTGAEMKQAIDRLLRQGL